jgi:hypothetical protein
MNLLLYLFHYLRALLRPARLAAENLALRQQLAIYLRTQPRPPLHNRDRRFCVWLSRWWRG